MPDLPKETELQHAERMAFEAKTVIARRSWRKKAAQLSAGTTPPPDLPKEAVEAAVSISTGITGDDAVARNRRRAAYERWFNICTCGHEPDQHDFSITCGDCGVKGCECQGYDHITGKPDHPCNPLPADDPRAPAIRNQEQERIEAERCESCDDTGIYEEGSEWAACGECAMGRGFFECLQSHAAEVRQQERERMREALRKDRREAEEIPSKPAQVAKCRYAEALLDTLEDSDG